jgi:DNA-binding response OmpR family regulator
VPFLALKAIIELIVPASRERVGWGVQMHVLLVEDERLVRESAAAVLRDAGFTVTEAASAEEALALAASNPDRPPAVVVTDLHLGPGMDGLAFGQEARGHWPEVGIVYATGHPDSLDGRLLGPRERYVVKPFTRAALLGAVRRLMPVRVLGFSLQ